jgi:pimeloyl-ACP methyl ester carboxylesterase
MVSVVISQKDHVMCFGYYLTIHYQDCGTGWPIVLLHGWTVDHRFELHDYEPIFAGRAGWRRIYVDLPGHGATPAAPYIQNMDGMLSVVVRFIDAVLPGDRFALAGTSAGGYLAQGVLRKMIDRVTGLLLRVPLVEPDPSRAELPGATVLVGRPDLRAALAPEETSGFDLAVVQSEAFLAKLRADSIPARRLADFTFLDAVRGGEQGFAYASGLEFLDPPFRGPTLVITGRQDHIVGYVNAWEILEDFPRATFAVLDRAGHILPVEQQKLFAALVDDWLERVEEFQVLGSR